MENNALILCDTNILIEVYKGNTTIITTLEKIGQHNIAVYDVTCAELLYGARNKKELQIIKKDLKKLIVLPISEKISNKAIHLIEEFTLSHNLNLPDALIASTAIHHDLKLFTLNSKDFKYMNQLELVNKS